VRHDRRGRQHALVLAAGVQRRGRFVRAALEQKRRAAGAAVAASMSELVASI
jgi:hypothetical protein